MGERFDSAILRALSAVDALWPAPGAAAPALTTAAAKGLGPGSLVGGRYKLDKELGRGAFGCVWRALDTANNDAGVALKELLPGAADDSSDGNAGSLATEFHTLARLKHPYIVGVQDFGELDGGARYLVMELVPGEDVFEKVKRGPIAKDEAARVLLGLAQGLQLLHARLFVHCDIKAENVRVTPKGDPKLMDFGLLHQLGTPAQAVQGTVAYMAPEMIQGGVIDARTDLYSLGVLAYEMFTGALPFDGATPLEVMHKHLDAKPKEPSWFLDLPKDVDDLVLSLLKKNPAQRPPSAAEIVSTLAKIAGTSVKPEPVSARTSYLYAANLVGRDKESRALDDVRTGLGEKRGAVVFLAGRGGEGKTRLLEEFRLRVKLDRAVWAAGQCRKEGLAPLAPMIEALTTLAARSSDDVIKPHGNVLSFLLPSLKSRGFAPPAFNNPQQAKLATSDAVAAWLKDVASVTPFVLCIEDLHWADGASLELINHVARALGSAPSCVLLATFRSDEVDRTSIVYSTVDEGIAKLVQLGPLKREHVDELLIATLRKHSIANEHVDEMFAATGGNAFFLIETLRAFVEAGDLAFDAGQWQAPSALPMPASIKDVVHRRLAHLPNDLLAVARNLAPIGRSLDPKLVAQVAELPPAQLAEMLDGLVERQVIVRQGAGFWFSHDSVRDVVYDETDEAARKNAHAKIGAILEEKSGTAPSQIAHHYKRSTDPDRAVSFFLAAAREAVGKQQLLEATMMLNEGNAVLEKSALKEKRTLTVTFNDMLAASSVATHPPSCVQAVGRLLNEWKDVDPDRVVKMMAEKKARIAKTPKILRRFVEDKPAKPGPPPPFDPSTRDPILIFERMQQVSGMRAMALAVLGEAEAAIAAADQLAKFAPPGSPHVAVAAVPKILGLLHMGRVKELRATQEPATAIFERAGDRLPPPLRIFWFLSLYLRGLSESLAGTTSWKEPAERAFAVAEKFDLPQEKGFARLPALVRACLCGEQDAFSSSYAGVEEITRRLGFPHVLNSRLRLWIPIYYLERGERDLARATTARLDAMAKATRDSWIATYASVYRGLDALNDGEPAKAVEALRAGVEGARAKKLGRLTTALCALAEAQLANGDVDDAKKTLSEAFDRAVSPDTGCPYDEAVAQRLLARVDTGDAEAHLRRALALSEEMQNATQEGHALLDLGALLERRGERDNARAMYGRARERFAAAGNKIATQRAQRAHDAAVGAA